MSLQQKRRRRVTLAHTSFVLPTASGTHCTCTHEELNSTPDQLCYRDLTLVLKTIRPNQISLLFNAPSCQCALPVSPFFLFPGFLVPADVPVPPPAPAPPVVLVVLLVLAPAAARGEGGGGGRSRRRRRPSQERLGHLVGPLSSGAVSAGGAGPGVRVGALAVAGAGENGVALPVVLLHRPDQETVDR